MKRFLIFLSVIFFTQYSLVKSQPAETPFHTLPLNIDFGFHDGHTLDEELTEYSQYFFHHQTKARTLSYPASSYKIITNNVSAIETAPWIRLRLADINLGLSSYLVITSLKDNDKQYFNSQSLKGWENQTAFFYGHQVSVELFVAPGDQNITLKITEMMVGEFLGNQPPSDYICGSDTRVSSSYLYVDGRILPIGCTGWITAGGFYITAGHCVNVTSYDLQVIQFNVPESLCDGTLVPCAIADQYPIIFSSRIYEDLDSGNDWGIFNVGENSNTGRTPHETERSYYHISSSLAPSNILVRGFGTDQDPVGCSGVYNSKSQTLQYDTGSSLGEFFNGSSDVYFEYLVDTQNGSSGSVLQSSGISGVSAHAIGVHTHGGCNPPSYGNKGTSFEADDTETAMNIYWQENCEYVDEGHHQSSTVGSSVRPCESLQTALEQADAGHGPDVNDMELIMVAGSNNGSGGVYAETINYSGATNGVYIRRVAGAIKIGPNAAAKAGSYGEETGEVKVNTFPERNSGEQVFLEENAFLPGQTKPFKEIGNHENE